MHVNSTVVHLTLTGIDVAGLADDPIQMRLPLPTGVGLTDDDSTDDSTDRRRRRRLGSSSAPAQTSDNETHTLECQLNEVGTRCGLIGIRYILWLFGNGRSKPIQ